MNDKPASPPASNSMMGLVPMTEDFSIEPPVTDLDDSDEKRKKRVSKSKQWKEIKEFLLARKELYRKQTPGGVNYNVMTKEDAAHYGGIGNAVMEEIDQFIAFIEGVY